MDRKIAVIGVGNMARAIIIGMVNSDLDLSELRLFDKNTEQYAMLPESKRVRYYCATSVEDALYGADCVLLAVKPQNYSEVLAEISELPNHEKKLYISIAAGITSESVSDALHGACVVRVLPNVPMLIGQGVSVICKNERVEKKDFDFVCTAFRCAGSVLLIQEEEMNRIISVTSSSPAYVFRFIDAIYKGALAQDLPDRKLLDAICDVVIGSALMLKQSNETPDELISRVASKGGTTEQALSVLKERDFEGAVLEAMMACTRRADALGVKEK